MYCLALLQVAAFVFPAQTTAIILSTMATVLAVYMLKTHVRSFCRICVVAMGAVAFLYCIVAALTEYIVLWWTCYGFWVLLSRAMLELGNLFFGVMFALMQSWPLLQAYLPFANFVWGVLGIRIYKWCINMPPTKGNKHFYKLQVYMDNIVQL
jgi:hypothetical protein